MDNPHRSHRHPELHYRQYRLRAAGEDGVQTSTWLMKHGEVLRAQGAWLLSSVRGVAPSSVLTATQFPKTRTRPTGCGLGRDLRTDACV
ncbi:aminodeoxychorismate lyase [Cutibacterium acnes JCM 18920]|nr:aminodeoxychorismate lyase [Cutibacterium acnes JCM 18920]